MNAELVRFIIAAVFLAAGIAVIAVSILGVFRFRFVLNRMHCAAITDTLGILFVFASLMIAAGVSVYLIKMLGVIIFLWMGSPIASHLVARMEILTDEEADAHMKLPEETKKEDPDDIF